MKFKKIEKEFMRTLVKYNDSVNSIDEVLNESKLLEKREIAIIPYERENLVFYNQEKYKNEKVVYAIVTELVSLIDLLVKERYIVPVPMGHSYPCVIGRRNAVVVSRFDISIDNGRETVHLPQFDRSWKVGNDSHIYTFTNCSEELLPIRKNLRMSYAVSQELRELVKNGFSTDEEIRFNKQQFATWVSIIIAFVIGIASIIISTCR